MASLLEKIQKSCSALSKTLGSTCKIMILSHRESISSSCTQAEPGDTLVVLGNGPSLRGFLDSGSHFLEGKMKMAVNFSATSPDYERLKPEYYLLMDPAFFSDNATAEKVFRPMREKTSWPMTLFVPFYSRKKHEWQNIIAGNRHIKTYFFNSTPIEGYKTFRRMCYRLNIGMPRPRNVLVACLMVALKLPFKTIYLAGADHSWLKEIWVDDNNVVQENRAHFYDRDGKTTKVTSKYKIYLLLESMSIAFRSYLEVEDYAKEINKKIYNITEGSYIDAFERMKIK